MSDIANKREIHRLYVVLDTEISCVHFSIHKTGMKGLGERLDWERLILKL